ncbi:MAG: cellulase family glycosylhydrolase [Candidatus Methylacidiphilales bacterium]|nr:cellulase family glycosylhydrolase [Candidatus Methylacidiphilales bacterium]
MTAPGRPPATWRGFNLCEMFLVEHDPRWQEMTPSGRGKFFREDFCWIADFGFNYVRLPLCYHWWGDPKHPKTLREEALEPVDRAVEWAAENGLDLSINFHHVPGFCVNQGLRDEHLPPEPWDLWTHPEGAEVLAHHWETFARRYAAAGPYLSFNILNEPARCSRSDHERVIRRAVQAIRHVDADRRIVVEGFNVGADPCPELSDLGCIQSCRGYWPGEITHHRLWWSWASDAPVPEWPDPGRSSGDGTFTREGLDQRYTAWKAFARQGHAVICGELGCSHLLPHPVALRWLEDELDVLNAAGFGWCLWNFRGSFGIIDSGREDVPYADFHGHRLDTAFLEILKRH